jgi:hypothetical protein
VDKQKERRSRSTMKFLLNFWKKIINRNSINSDPKYKPIIKSLLRNVIRSCEKYNVNFKEILKEIEGEKKK